MNQKFIKKAAFSAILVAAFSVSSITAQAVKTEIRRNSPFAPNPKKRAESSAGLQNTEETKAVKIGANETVQNSENIVAAENNAANLPPAADFDKPTIAKNTLEIARRAGEAAISPVETYKIGKGDVLFISLQNAPPKETNYFTVLENGTIDYPLAGEMISVGGLTAEETEDLLKEKIKLYENPQVSIKVREYNSHTYTVLGAVEKAGEKKLQREAVPLFVVRAEAVVDAKVSRASIKRKNSDVQEVDLKDSASGETLVFAGDIVEFIADESAVSAAKTPQFYYIGGEIASSGQKDFHQGITLTQAILASGGLKKASVKKVIIRRKNADGTLTPLEVNLKAVKDGKAIDPTLQIGDTVEIGN